MVTPVTTAAFESVVKQASQPVLIDFYAEWCGPCKLVGPILEEIEKERAGLTIVKVNVDEEPELARQHQVMSIPTLILYSGGKMKATWVGLRPKQVLLAEIEKAVQA